MKCPKCGNEIDNGALFCDECGAKINASNNTNSEGGMNVNPQINMYTQQNTAEKRAKNENRYAGNKTVKTSKEPKALEVISLVFGILSIVTLGCFIFPEIVAIVCGSLCKDEQGKRTKLANVGFICGIISAILYVILLAIGMSA